MTTAIAGVEVFATEGCSSVFPGSSFMTFVAFAVAPRPMSKAEIRQTVADFGVAAKNALEAGFDGVQIQANYLYLIAQFLNSATNLRTDEYGGSIVNRARFLFEIVETVLNHVEPGRVGIKIGPMHLTGPFVANADTLPGMEYVMERLSDYSLAHLLYDGCHNGLCGNPAGTSGRRPHVRALRPIYNRHLIANVDMTPERANRLIAAGLADSIAFGRPYIANPDLPERFLTSAQLNQINWPKSMHQAQRGTSIIPRW
jgi:N-ethylmaleimide reductase